MRLTTRKCTSDSCWLLMDMNTGPQTDISSVPWAEIPASPVMALTTRIEANFPSFHLARTVRSACGTLSAAATGPSPFPTFP